MTQRTIPKSGWVVVGHIDHRAQVMPCAKCNRHVRYGVVLQHPDVAGTVEAGSRCSVWMSGGTPAPGTPHDAPAATAVDPVEAAIEAREADDEYGAELGKIAELAVWRYASGHEWVHWLDARREGLPMAVLRHRAGLVPGAPREISLRRLAQIADFLVAHHATPIQPTPGLLKPPPAEVLLLHLPRAKRRAALAAQARA